MSKKLSQKLICENVEKLGYRFIGPYEGNRKPLPVECKCGCGEIITLPYSKLLLGRGCKRVNNANRVKAHTFLMEEVVSIIESRGFKYVSGDYVNNKSPLHILCRCGEIFVTTLADAKHRIGCNKCAQENVVAGLRYSLIEVRQIFATYSCELLATEYKNNQQRLAFRCSCGKLSEKSLCQIVKSEGGCRFCAPKRISEKHIARLAPFKMTIEEKKNKVCAYVKRRNLTDVEFHIRNSMRGRVRSAVLRNGARKSATTFELIGCTAKELRSHLESLWQPGMSWENYGNGGWHIDHILPCASFDLIKPEEQRKCFHYTNLQPLWWRENCVKSSRLPDGRRITVASRLREQKIVTSEPEVQDWKGF